MSGISATTDIRCAASAVFDYLAQIENQAKWMPSIEKVDHTGGSPGKTGSTYRQVVKMMGMTQEGTLEVIECEPGTRLRTSVKGGPGKIESLFELTEEGGGTRVKMTVDAGPMGAIMSPMIRAQLEKGLAQLKTILEG
ncbi:MAG: SRPBCC family protein [Candidatus Binatia bacterium]